MYFLLPLISSQLFFASVFLLLFLYHLKLPFPEDKPTTEVLSFIKLESDLNELESW